MVERIKSIVEFLSYYILSIGLQVNQNFTSSARSVLELRHLIKLRTTMVAPSIHVMLGNISSTFHYKYR